MDNTRGELEEELRISRQAIGKGEIRQWDEGTEPWCWDEQIPGARTALEWAGRATAGCVSIYAPFRLMSASMSVNFIAPCRNASRPFCTSSFAMKRW